MLVVVLVLGHVCDVSALGHSDAHHAGEGQAGQALSPCDPAPAASSSGQAGSPWTEGAQEALPRPAAAEPDREAGITIAPAATPVPRPPLFLLHAALLI